MLLKTTRAFIPCNNYGTKQSIVEIYEYSGKQREYRIIFADRSLEVPSQNNTLHQDEDELNLSQGRDELSSFFIANRIDHRRGMLSCNDMREFCFSVSASPDKT